MSNAERRSFPRVTDEGVTLKLNLGDFDAVTHTLNISASGLYCKVDRELPLMSRVKLKLMLPTALKDDQKSRGFEVDGVVVRGHPVIIEGETRHYDVAIFFENLSQKSREAILDYTAKKSRD